MTGIDDVFVASTASAPQIAERSWKSSRFSSSRSGAASITKSQPGEALERGGRVQAALGGVGVLRAPAPALGALREVGAGLLDAGRERVRDRVVHVRLDAGERAQLRDAGAHRAGADDAQTVAGSPAPELAACASR